MSATSLLPELAASIGLDAPQRLAQPPATRQRQKFLCPNCESIIYSRRNLLCGVCCHPLPAEFLFERRDADGITSQLRLERARHRDWMRRRE